MEPKNLERSIGNILVGWRFNEPTSLPEEIAIRRFWKKLEIPDKALSAERRRKAFDSWWEFDQSLSLPPLLSRNWRRARILISESMKGFSLAPVAFSGGSEATPTYGYNSIESKLMRSKWECSPQGWDLWLEAAYGNMALKRCTRARFNRHMLLTNGNVTDFHRESWLMCEHLKLDDRRRFCFARMLSRVTFPREASRWSSVRKTNEKDRPIDVQPLCNMLCQRRIGEGLRNLLKRVFSVDLDTLAAKHRLLVSDNGNSTIDLKDASDSIQLDLVRYLFPHWFVRIIESARMSFVEGLDGHYYSPRKVSSMGNGFTFELMSFILLAIGRQHSDQFSVFGDDIIVPNADAESLIGDLVEVGFVINRDKTHIGGEYRESCGAHYLDGYGYIRSFDFEYPESIHDAIVAFNKVAILSERYPQFDLLRVQLSRCVPHVLQGPYGEVVRDDSMHVGMGQDRDLRMSTFFWFKKPKGGAMLQVDRIRNQLGNLHLSRETIRGFYGFVWRPKLASKSLRSLRMRSHVGKYHAYLLGGRLVPDTVTGQGCWQKVAYAQVGERAFRAKSLVQPGSRS